MESRDTLNTKKERERDRNESRAIWEKGASERERESVTGAADLFVGVS